MTEFAPTNTEALQGTPQERFVFISPDDLHRREFEVATTQPTRIGADNPEVNAAVEAAYAAAQSERRDAAEATPEHRADDAKLAQAVGWNGEAIEATRDYAEQNGLHA